MKLLPLTFEDPPERIPEIKQRRERNTEQFNELSKLLNDEFKKSNNRDMNEAELNYIRNVLVDLTATENPRPRHTRDVHCREGAKRQIKKAKI